jgi:hypothetical protein
VGGGGEGGEPALAGDVYGVPLLFSATVAILSGVVGIGLVFVGSRLREEAQIDDAWADLRRLTVREAFRLVELRIGSLVALSSSVFMRRVRNLVYGAAFTDEEFRGRIAPVLIYDMDREYALFREYPWLRPGEKLRALAKKASAVKTTLWLSGPDELDTLANAGEATACFALLRHLLADADGRLASGDAERRALLERLMAAWREIRRRAEDPDADAVPVGI